MDILQQNFKHLMINYASAWAADIAPAGMHILCIALRYNKPKKSKISYISLFKKFLGLLLRFRYFEL